MTRRAQGVDGRPTKYTSATCCAPDCAEPRFRVNDHWLSKYCHRHHIENVRNNRLAAERYHHRDDPARSVHAPMRDFPPVTVAAVYEDWAWRERLTPVFYWGTQVLGVSERAGGYQLLLAGSEVWIRVRNTAKVRRGAS